MLWKLIKLKCSCGAEMEWRDHTGSYINDGGQHDDKGRMYLVEVRADEWLDRHQPCIKVQPEIHIKGEVADGSAPS